MMIPITIKRIALIVWLLENVDKEISVLEATRESQALNYHATYIALKDLASVGYLRVTRSKRYQVANAPALVNQLALTLPLRLKPMVSFFLGGGMLEKMQLLSSREVNIVFTLFAGAELLSPYVKTSMVHAYVREASIEKLTAALVDTGGRRAVAGDADTYLLPTQHNFILDFSRRMGSFRIAPIGVLLADLKSHGGLGEEQANRIMKEWLSRQSSS